MQQSIESSTAAVAEELVQRALEAVRELSGVAAADDDAAALAEADALLDLLAEVRGVAASRLRQLELRDAPDVAGYPSVVAWARTRDGSDPRDAARLLRLARASERCPETGALWRAGRVSAAHLDAVETAVGGLGLGLAEAGDAFLAAQAPEFTAPEFLRLAQAWRDTVVPEITTDERNAAADAQHLTVSPTTGGALVRGWLTGDNAAWFVAALDRFSKPVPHDTRTAGRRRADAAGLISRIATSADDEARAESGNVEPLPVATVTVLADPVVLQRALAARDAQPALPGWLPRTARELAGPAVDERTGVPLSTAELLAMVCDGHLGRALLDAPAEQLDLGRRVRLFSTAQRRALARGRRPACSWRRCGSPWVEAHHARAWQDGGGTDLANGHLLCRYHHSLVHLGWQLTDSGRPLAPPDWDLIRRRPTRLRQQRGAPV